ncbi:hypothetical protein G9A89_012825 [Geosiphon pyriformis]|nr:hypothetical protein G9A89_012825 [Geosiphon pyriformis]
MTTEYSGGVNRIFMVNSAVLPAEDIQTERYYIFIKNNAAANLSTTGISSSTISTSSTSYLSITATITPKDTLSNNLETNQKLLVSNISPATVMKDESLVAIFPFKIEELSTTLLFSGAVLKEKPNTVMYTDIKIDDHTIKLILNNRSAGSIIT